MSNADRMRNPMRIALRMAMGDLCGTQCNNAIARLHDRGRENHNHNHPTTQPVVPLLAHRTDEWMEG